MNILVIGAGAIGCLVGGKLAQQEQAVTLVGRPRLAEAVRDRGLILVDEAGRHQIETVSASGSIDEAFALASLPYDLAVITVKCYDTQTALDELIAAVAQHSKPTPTPTLLSLQNGVGNEEAIAEQIGSACVIAGTITTPVSVLDVGAIQVDKPRYTVGVSPWHPAVSARIMAATQAAFQQAGFGVLNYPNAQGMKWTKLLMNMLGNATSAILDEPPDTVFADPMLLDIEIEAWREALNVMAAAGIPPVNIGRYPFGLLGPLVRRTPNALLRPILRRQIGGARGGKMPSLHIDLHGGKGRSEVAWLNGAVVKRGRKLSVPTPVNEMLNETLLKLLDDPRERELWKHDRMRLIVTADDFRRRAQA